MQPEYALFVAVLCAFLQQMLRLPLRTSAVETARQTGTRKQGIFAQNRMDAPVAATGCMCKCTRNRAYCTTNRLVWRAAGKTPPSFAAPFLML